jgi:hypothetical protein
MSLVPVTLLQHDFQQILKYWSFYIYFFFIISLQSTKTLLLCECKADRSEHLYSPLHMHKKHMISNKLEILQEGYVNCLKLWIS